jgi:hypothetical protein
MSGDTRVTQAKNIPINWGGFAGAVVWGTTDRSLAPVGTPATARAGDVASAPRDVWRPTAASVRRWANVAPTGTFVSEALYRPSQASTAQSAVIRRHIAIRSGIALMNARTFDWIRGSDRAVMWTTRACRPRSSKESA